MSGEPMTDKERHVKRFVFGKLLPVRGVGHVWERSYGWHWVVEQGRGWHKLIEKWDASEWLNPRNPKPIQVILSSYCD